METLQTLGVESERVLVEEFAQSMPTPEGTLYKVNILLANGSN